MTPPGADTRTRPRADAPWNDPERLPPRRDREGRPAGGARRRTPADSGRAPRRGRAEPASGERRGGRSRRPAPADADRPSARADRPARRTSDVGATGTVRISSRPDAARRGGRTRPAPSGSSPLRGHDVARSASHTVAGAGRAAASAVESTIQVRRRRAAERRALQDAVRRPVDHRRRLLVVLAVLAALFAVVVSKVADLQVISPGHYLAWGEAQRVHTQALAAERGAILDRNGAELAVSRPAKSIFVDPSLIEDPAAEAAQVAPLLGLDVNDVTAAMAGDGRFTYLARKVDPDVAAQVEALGLDGVASLDESERYLPAGSAGLSTIGLTDPDNKGLSGLEAMYDQQLTGTPGSLSIEQNPDGRTIAVGEQNVTPAVPGDDLVLTLDRTLQLEAERILAEEVQASEAKGGIAIVTKPGTGEILAMANVETDPDTGEVRPSTNNAAVTTQYEPGSVMKMATISAALEAGVITPDEHFNLPPTKQIYDYEIGEAETRGTVWWGVNDIVAHSSNVGTVTIAERLGADGLTAAFRDFGFGVPTSLGFPNEVAGIVKSPDDFDGTTLATMSIGQGGVDVSPLQMLLAYNVIANGGVYVPPQLVRSTVDGDGVEHPSVPGEGHRVVSEQTADEMNVMLRSVVDIGTGQAASIPGYNVAGKTGTALKAMNGRYTDDQGIKHYQSTFVGFVPAEQPALSIYVMIDDPSGGTYTGGRTAAPAFSKLGSFALSHLGIPPAATDAANGGAPVEGGEVPHDPALVTTEGDRVKVLPTGSTVVTTTIPEDHEGSGGSTPSGSSTSG